MSATGRSCSEALSEQLAARLGDLQVGMSHASVVESFGKPSFRDLREGFPRKDVFWISATKERRVEYATIECEFDEAGILQVHRELRRGTVAYVMKSDLEHLRVGDTVSAVVCLLGAPAEQRALPGGVGWVASYTISDDRENAPYQGYFVEITFDCSGIVTAKRAFTL